ncbi:MAG: 30S ribosomal protein S19e [Candidatus Aenigmatarchaeota archaeon]
MPLTRDVDAEKLIIRTAGELEKLSELKPPEWSGFVKTGPHKERAPLQANWWHIRAASVLRKLCLGEPAGVSRLRKVYGGRKNRGHKPEHKYKASGAVLRKLLQQLEAAGLVKAEKGKGRTITLKGRAFLDSVAKGMK